MNGKNPKRKPKKKPKKAVGTMNIILAVVGICLLVFTVYMIELYKLYGSVPDTLITCVFACLGGECGVMGWIKTTKERNKERKWEIDDRKASETKNISNDNKEDTL